MAVSLKRLLSEFSRAVPPVDVEAPAARAFIRARYDLARNAATNKQKQRLFDHSTKTALTLAELGLSPELIGLALVHHFEPDEIAKCPEVSEQVLERVKSIRELHGHALDGTELVRRLRDPEVLFVVLASALDTLTSIAKRQPYPKFELAFPKPPEELAQSILDYLSLFAHFYHAVDLTWRLEDAIFAVCEPKKFRRLRKRFLRPDEATQVVNDLKDILGRTLAKQFPNVNPDNFVRQGRGKSAFGAYKKLETTGVASVWQLGDLLALRVVIKDHLVMPGKDDHETLGESRITSEEKLFRACLAVAEAIGGLHGLAVSRTDDYFHYPTKSGYQALHITIPVDGEIREVGVPPDIENIEVQIRTKKLHEKAEFGEWSHVKYKLSRLEPDGPVAAWRYLWAKYFDSKTVYRSADGSIRFIARGSTYADAAYDVIEQPSEQTRHPMLVNVQNTDFTKNFAFDELFEPLVPMSRITVLQAGDHVGTIKPSMIGNLRTLEARERVADLFAHQAQKAGRDPSAHISAQGRRILKEEQALTRRWSFNLDVDGDGVEDALEAASSGAATYQTMDELFSGVAKGDLKSVDLIQRWNELFRIQATSLHVDRTSARTSRWKKARLSQTIFRGGQPRFAPSFEAVFSNEDLHEVILLCTCCGPLPGDKIVAWNEEPPKTIASRLNADFISLTHHQDCPVTKGSHGPTIIDGELWPDAKRDAYYIGQLEVLVHHRPGVLAALTRHVSDDSPVLNIENVVARRVYDASSCLWLELEVQNSDDLERIRLSVLDELDEFVISAIRPVAPND